MLADALSKRVDAAFMPILIYGYDFVHAKALMDSFLDMAIEEHIDISSVYQSRLWVVLNGNQMFEFRSYKEEDSPSGKDYSHIFIDHYAEEMHG